MKRIPSKVIKDLHDEQDLLNEDAIGEQNQVDPSYLKQMKHILGDIGEGLNNVTEDLETAFWLVEKVNDGKINSVVLPKLKKLQREVQVFEDIKELIDDILEDVSNLIGD